MGPRRGRARRMWRGWGLTRSEPRKQLSILMVRSREAASRTMQALLPHPGLHPSRRARERAPQSLTEKGERL